MTNFLPSNFFEITHDPISIDPIALKVKHADHGAEILFLGSTREHTYGKKTVHLEYEGYTPMALKMLQQIGEEIFQSWDGVTTAITHRLGKVDVGGISVVIAVSAPHRQAAYEASRYAIERLKEIVPIWKKEVWDDGTEWVGHQKGPWNPMDNDN